MSTISKQIQSLPNSPGIYLFYNSKKELLYVGKATSLKSRVKSYFVSLLSFPRKRESSSKFSGSPIKSGMTRPIESMIHEVKKIKTVKTDSVLEAIILEGNYIKKFRPKYNVDWKDDKSWNFLAITNEKFTKLISIRQHEIQNSSVIPAKAGIQTKKQKAKNWIPGSRRNASSPEDDNKKIFGPYPHLNTRETLKILHKLFYISRCEAHQKKPCFDYQIGHCLGVCTGEISPKEYHQKVIKPLTEFLKGNKKRLLSNLKKQMSLASKQQNFEEAARLRNQIKSLSHIQDVTLLTKEFFVANVIPAKAGIQKDNSWIPDQREIAVGNLSRNDKKILRIEAYDISNLGSTDKVGSMVVFDTHGPIKSEYRKFKIKKVIGQSDVDCLKEIIERRFNNNWPLPDLILVDGGVPQRNAVLNILNHLPSIASREALRAGKSIFLNLGVIGIAKGPERKKNEFIFDKNNQKIADFIQANEILLINARDEAHRFAISYQKKLRKIK